MTIYPSRWKRAVARGALAAVALAGGLAAAAPAHATDQNPHIIGGQPADRAYSFMASLQWEQGGDPNHHRCGGTLIRKDWVVTAAHCVTDVGTGTEPYTLLDPTLFHVRVGSKDRTEGGVVANVTDAVIEPGFRFPEDDVPGRDIALLHLDTALSLSTIAPFSVPSKPGTMVRAIGWGYTDTTSTTPPIGLRQLDTRLIAFDATGCQVDENGNSKYGAREGDLCTDNPGGVNGPCNGDSGSPLVQEVNNHLVLVGVDSRSIADVCGTEPEVFTSVDYYYDWITSVVG